MIMAFGRVKQLAWQLWTLGATREVCSELLSETVLCWPDHTRWRVNIMTLLSSQLTAKYRPAIAPVAAGGSGSESAVASVQQQPQGSAVKSPAQL